MGILNAIPKAYRHEYLSPVPSDREDAEVAALYGLKSSSIQANPYDDGELITEADREILVAAFDRLIDLLLSVLAEETGEAAALVDEDSDPGYDYSDIEDDDGDFGDYYGHEFDDYSDYPDDDFLLGDRGCRHTSFAFFLCTNCELEDCYAEKLRNSLAEEEWADEDEEDFTSYWLRRHQAPLRVTDPFRMEQEAHLRRKRRQAARRDQTLRYHSRDERVARVMLARRNDFPVKGSVPRTIKALKAAPWQARHRRIISDAKKAEAAQASKSERQLIRGLN